MRRAIKRARSLRKQATVPEQIVWRWLRDRRFRGCKFRRQYPIGGFIADFCSIPVKPVIELDGGFHTTDEQIRHDEMRDAYIRSRGFTVIRVWNDEIRADPTAVAD